MKVVITIIVYFFLGTVVWASSLKVMPTRIDLLPRDRIATLTLSNPGQEPILIQTELLQWEREEGKDLYLPTQDLIVLPPAFSIPAGGKQQIRIALQRQVLKETAYRLYVAEIPIKENIISSTGLKIALRMGIPIFVQPQFHEKK